MKEKTYKRMLVYTKAKRCTFWHIAWPGILPIEGSNTPRCHRPQRIEACSFIHASRFPAHCKPETTQNIHARLPRDQATRLLAHRSAQPSATHWGRYTATPNALKSTLLYPCIAFCHTPPTRNDTYTSMHASTKVRQHAFWCIAQPNV